MRQDLEACVDAELVVRAARGEEAAFVVLMRRHASRVRALLRRMGADAALADDLAQEAFIAAWRGLAAFRGEAAFGTWVCRIAARLYVKRWRKDARTVLLADPPQTETQPSHELASNARLALDEALRLLSPAERICVSLCHGAGLSHSEAAEALGAPLGTVKSHVKRGLDKLRTALEPQGGRSGTLG